ncbi:FtsK/SpoIIIE family DNA translocase [Aureibacillus halotolerans]|uniref:DNA translocase FtsK n=1 Tax=Aureibacillus halotolerans TaxID=1508390 RepID=A0A4R6U9F8_9BACI|nr:DNA translocase FtsK [Aureibacillus halotolerans]TDQ39704.1 DNA translocase FtsK [Aureibacillus halotolerans]
MASTRKKKQTKKKRVLLNQFYFEISGLLLLVLTVITVAQLGAVGLALYELVRFLAGSWYSLPLFACLLLSLYFIFKRKWPAFFTRRLSGAYLIVLSVLLFSHVSLFETLSRHGVFEDPSVIRNTYQLFMQEASNPAMTVQLGGGMIGAVFYALFHFLFAATGTRIFALFIAAIGVLLLSGKSLHDLFGRVSEWLAAAFHSVKKNVQESLTQWKQNKSNQASKPSKRRESREVLENDDEAAEIEDESVDQQAAPIIADFTETAYGQDEPMAQASPQADHPNELVQDEKGSDDQQEQQDQQKADGSVTLVMREMENKQYKLPTFSLLSPPKSSNQSTEKRQLAANAKKLEKTFQSFGVNAKVTKVHLGPAVTKYEVYPDVGVKVSKIVNLNDDLALALAAKDIRIEAPIPGKSAVGIEVPNKEVAMVNLREVLDTKNAHSSKSHLLMALGRDISGEAILAELNKMPHLLVAGATGSGKSVCVNGIIVSILMRAKPHEVKMMMIDPKMVELNVYNGIPHLLAPVVTDPKKASQALKKVVSEMERRYDLFSHSGTRNIEGYNDYVNKQNAQREEQQPQLPFIVVIVDELADLMMVASGDVEDAITRLAQMARAAGIHLIIATQRPSVDVITGVIKANIPSRIAFSVSSQIDSRTILDSGGAEKLLGRGDMLFMPVGASRPVRVQGAFLSDDEVERVVEHVITQQKAQYQDEMIPDDTQEVTSDVEDDLYHEAVALIADMQTASVSMLQRRFRIGYTRAARLIDAMEERNIVGPYEGSKPREVLVSKPSDEPSSQSS